MWIDLISLMDGTLFQTETRPTCMCRPPPARRPSNHYSAQQSPTRPGSRWRPGPRRPRGGLWAPEGNGKWGCNSGVPEGLYMYMYTNLIVSIGEDIDELCDGPGVAQLAQAVRHLMLEQGGLVTEASLHLSRTIVIQFSNQVLHVLHQSFQYKCIAKFTQLQCIYNYRCKSRNAATHNIRQAL